MKQAYPINFLPGCKEAKTIVINEVTSRLEELFCKGLECFQFIYLMQHYFGFQVDLEMQTAMLQK